MAGVIHPGRLRWHFAWAVALLGAGCYAFFLMVTFVGGFGLLAGLVGDWQAAAVAAAAVLPWYWAMDRYRSKTVPFFVPVTFACGFSVLAWHGGHWLTAGIPGAVALVLFGALVAGWPRRDAPRPFLSASRPVAALLLLGALLALAVWSVGAATAQEETPVPVSQEPRDAEGEDLVNTMCWRVPACPASIIFLGPMIVAGMSFSLGAREPLLLGGIAGAVFIALLVVAFPNPFLFVVFGGSVLAAVLIWTFMRR